MGQFGRRPSQTLFSALLFLLCTSTTSLDEKTQNAQEKIVISPVIKPETQVEILNVLPDKQSLTIHCKSKDDDLGVHVLPYDGTFAWANVAVTFDAYKAKRDYNKRCNYDCNRIAFGDGIYGFTDHSGHDITIPCPKPSAN